MFLVWYVMPYLLTATGLTPGGSSTVHIYTQTIHITTIKYKKNRVNIVFDYIFPIHTVGKKIGQVYCLQWRVF